MADTRSPTMSRLVRISASLKFRLALASVLVITVCVALATQLVLMRVHRGVERALMDMEMGNAERMAAVVSSRIVALQSALRTLADDPALHAALDDPAQLGRRLEGATALRTMFSGLYVADLNGRVSVVCDADGAHRADIAIGDRPHFRQALQQHRPVVSGPLRDRRNGEPSIQMMMPVHRTDGALVAVLGASLRLSTRSLIDELTQRGQIAEDPVSTVVIDAGGRILAHPHADAVMQRADSRPELAGAIERWTAQGQPIEASGDVSMQADGRIVASAGVPAADWVVLRIASIDTLLGSEAEARRASLRLAAAVALAGGLLLLLLLHLALRPLDRLRRRASMLGTAGLRLDEGWPDVAGEIGELSTVLRRAMRDRAASEHEAAALLRQLQSVMDAAPIGIALTRRRRFELVSLEFAALLDWQVAELAGRPAVDIFDDADEYEALGSRVAAAFAGGRPFTGELRFRRRDGNTLWGRLQGRPVDAADAEAGTIWLLEDVTQQRADFERLAWSANHDALTRVANRAAFETRLGALLATGTAAATLMFIDLDHFKRVNDNAGHAAGDDVLREVAALLAAQVRGSDMVARLGGDEFALLLAHDDADAALRLAEQVRVGIGRIGVHHGGEWFGIGASIGVVAVSPADRSVAALLARADVACYQAKREGRGTVRVATLAEAP